jgi:hypothetical protein
MRNEELDVLLNDTSSIMKNMLEKGFIIPKN